MVSPIGLCHDLDRTCFALLFEIENYLRLVLRWELRGRFGKEWLGILPADVKSNAKARVAQEREIGYLDPRKSSLLSYLNLSELKDLIVESSLWNSCFKFYWPPQEVVRTEFRKLLAIRNKSAHFRPVTSRDLRVAHRFAEDLADWSRQYRRPQADSKILRWDSTDAEAFLASEGLGQMEVGWGAMVENGEARRLELSIETVTHHLAFSFVIPEGSANPDLFLRCLEKYEGILTFCRIGDLADRFALYIPRKHAGSDVAKLFQDVWEIASTAGPGISSEDVRPRFEVAEREAVLPWDLEMPTSFRHKA